MEHRNGVELFRRGIERGQNGERQKSGGVNGWMEVE